MKTTRTARSYRAAVLGALLAVAIGSLGVGAAQADDGSPAPAGTSPSATDSASPDDSGTTPSADDSGSADPSSPATTPSSPRTAPAKQPAAKVNMCQQLPKPACVNVTDDAYFNYPFSGSSNRYRLRNLITRMVNSVPGTRMANGHRNQIRIAQFSVNDDTLVNALMKARQRGVSVQVLVDRHNVHGTKNFGSSPSFIRLMKKFGGDRGVTSPSSKRFYQDVSWARYCYKSCRGTGGDVHYKMILFSNLVKASDGTATTSWTTVMGSPNLTMLAAQGQWNHQNVYVDNTPNHQTYGAYSRMYYEMSLDRKASPTFRQYGYGLSTTGAPYDFRDAVPYTYFYPKASTASTDPGMRFFNGIKCTGAAPGYGNNGRTIIRIGQYAWFEGRGQWFAKRVRSLWNNGCDVRIETSVMGNTVKHILMSSSGRGRIPIKQIGTQDRHGKWLTYDHAKWVTVSGNVDGNSRAVKVTQGTTNWSNLAMYSDDFMQVYSYDGTKNDTGPDGTNWVGTKTRLYKRFYDNFTTIWKGPRARSLSPASRIPGDLGGKNARLGVGKYANLETD